MSIRGAMADLAAGVMAEFADDEAAIHVPTNRLPNARPAARSLDPNARTSSQPAAVPNHVAYEVCGIFDENMRGSKPREAELQPNREKTAVHVLQSVPCFTAHTNNWTEMPQQADELVIRGKCYRVLSVERAMDCMTRVLLEHAGKPFPG